MWNDNTVSQSDSSSIACKRNFLNYFSLIVFLLANTLKALSFNPDSERNFNERLLVSLGFVKVSQMINSSEIFGNSLG